MRSVQRGISATFLVIAILAIAVASAVGYFAFSQNLTEKIKAINSFEECAKHYPVMESYPEQCNTPEGKHFARELTEEEKQRLVSPSEPSPTSIQPHSASVKEGITLSASKLSPRLKLLANWAITDTMPVDTREQARLLGLAESGGGSLSRNAAGNPVVDVRLLDTSAKTIEALRLLPSDVLSIAPEYSTVTLAIAPERLTDLASITSVQYVGEVIQGGGNSPGGSSGAGFAQ